MYGPQILLRPTMTSGSMQIHKSCRQDNAGIAKSAQVLYMNQTLITEQRRLL